MKIALYARVSTLRQAEKDLSIPDQLRQLRSWSESNRHVICNEYIEPGATATDDKRPAFQQMILDASSDAKPFDAIVVHSLSRFFRDQLELGLYERRLNRHGVKLISVTQQTADDPAGQMARKIFSLFDEYQSRENGKHTLRAMRENARQGYWNGARPPYGYRLEATEAKGNRGQPKHRLVVCDAEAAIVHQIYHLYLHGINGLELGMKAIARHLTEQGLTMRGSPWRIQKIQKILSDTVYIGQFVFNQIEAKSGQKKPESEWVQVAVPPLVENATFEATRMRREGRRPSEVAPRLLQTPTLLTGLLKCGCGASMTLVTGKSGRYQYYKCTTRQNKLNQACTSPNLSVPKIDQFVLQRFAEHVLQPQRLATKLADLSVKRQQQSSQENQKLASIRQALQENEARANRLYQAIEEGFLPLDAQLQGRVDVLQKQRGALLLQLAELEREAPTIPAKLTTRQMQAFCSKVKEKLFDGDKAFARRYLMALINEIKVEDKRLILNGSLEKLEATMAITDSLEQSAQIHPEWRPHGDSNPGYRRERAMS